MFNLNKHGGETKSPKSFKFNYTHHLKTLSRIFRRRFLQLNKAVPNDPKNSNLKQNKYAKPKHLKVNDRNPSSLQKQPSQPQNKFLSFSFTKTLGGRLARW